MDVNGHCGEVQYRRKPTAIKIKDTTVVNVVSNGRFNPCKFLAEISERLDRHRLMIDLISSGKQSLSLEVSTEGKDKEISMIGQLVTELYKVGTVTVQRNMSIVSVVGHKMRNTVRIASNYSTQSLQTW